jgi:hypothetical protein
MNGFDGYADLVAPNPCGACSCGAPAGSCALPATLTASADTCADTNAASERTPFDPPPAWDGSCTASDAVPFDQPCANGPCARSLEIAAPVISEGACVPSALTAPVDPPHFTTVAHSCQGWPGGACTHSDQVCAPIVPPHDGAMICIQHAGDVPCPGPDNSPYGIRHVVYHGLADHRVCSPCSCGAPAGSACTAVVSIYPDDACASAPSYVETIDALAPACHDLTPGASLGSKSASSPAYTPGVCAPSGGEPVGAVELLGASTLCCIHVP